MAMVFFLVVCLYFSLSCSLCADLFQEHDGIIRHVFLEPEHAIKRRSIDQPIRISLDFIDISEVENQERVKRVLEKARDFFTKLLQVRATVPKILLQRSCANGTFFLKHGVRYCKESCNNTRRVCGSAEAIPREAFDACRVCDQNGKNCTNATGPGSGAGSGHGNTDFVLYVTAIKKSKCSDEHSNTVAFASVCQQESGMDRPVAGSLNICPDKVTNKELDNSYGQILATLKHEIFHALGFSPSLYAFYRNTSGDPLTPREQNGLPRYSQDEGNYLWSDQVIKKITRNNWMVHSGNVTHTVHVMVTPRVLEEVRQQFDCSTLEGAELENQGGDGTALAHWEKRIFENEGMTGIYTQNSAFSRLTLALMEDTGWYKVNYDMAQPLRWGKNLGCIFAKNSCKAWMDTHGKNLDPFCNETRKESGCSEDRTAVAMCNLKEFNQALPQQYQYFKSAKVGGGVELADFCPYYQGFTWTKGQVDKRQSGCTSERNSKQQKENYALEKYGQSSRCFKQGMKWKRRKCNDKVIVTASDWGSGCYEYKCEKDGLRIILEGNKFRCFHKGQVINVTVEDSEEAVYKGSLICPSCKEICYASGVVCPAEIKPAPENSQPTPKVCSSAAVHVVEALFLFLVAALAGILGNL